MPTEPPRKKRRTANACLRCRQSKIKCSGEEPCANCQRRFVPCHFEDGIKVTLPRRYVEELQSQGNVIGHRISRTSRQPELRASRLGADSEVIECATSRTLEVLETRTVDHASSIWTSPFTLPSTTIKNTHKNKRNWIWLAPSSTWSFTTRLAVMMTEKLHPESPRSPPAFWNGDLYRLQWQASGIHEPPDISGLPSIDHALYFSQTVSFHLGQIYRFFDEEEFVRSVQDFYRGNALEKANESRLWFVQFLLVLAFGTAFLSRSRNKHEPPGSKFFLRAMSLMPDQGMVWKDSLLAIEVLALAGLYLYSVDLRESAHVYLGQAIRIAQLEGLHTQLPEDQLGAETVARCRHLWWSLYILDRHFSSSLGLPMSTPDGDITTLLEPASTCSYEDGTLSLQVKLSHLLSDILTIIYKSEKTQLGIFLENTRSILHTMAGHAKEIERQLSSNPKTPPRGTRHITLLYHQCVIFATRPLLLSVLKELLQHLDHDAQQWQVLIPLTKTLMYTGIKSAAKTLQILSDEDSLLEVFLPFDLEYLYGASVHLAMADVLFPSMFETQTHSQDAHSILDEMIHKGNRVAETRKAELQNLEGLFKELAARVNQQGIERLTLSYPTERTVVVVESESLSTERQQGGLDPVVGPSTETPPASPPPSSQTEMLNSAEFLDNIGISSCDFLSIVDQIGSSQDDFCYSLLDPF